MVQESLDAFARFDADLALSVAQYDKTIDREYKTALRELVTYMMEDPRAISRVLNIIWALRSLERIGDHARNIAELVIYLVRGTDVRHMGLARMQEEVKGTANKAGDTPPADPPCLARRPAMPGVFVCGSTLSLPPTVAAGSAREASLPCGSEFIRDAFLRGDVPRAPPVPCRPALAPPFTRKGARCRIQLGKALSAEAMLTPVL